MSILDHTEQGCAIIFTGISFHIYLAPTRKNKNITNHIFPGFIHANWTIVSCSCGNRPFVSADYWWLRLCLMTLLHDWMYISKCLRQPMTRLGTSLNPYMQENNYHSSTFKWPWYWLLRDSVMEGHIERRNQRYSSSVWSLIEKHLRETSLGSEWLWNHQSLISSATTNTKLLPLLLGTSWLTCTLYISRAHTKKSKIYVLQ